MPSWNAVSVASSMPPSGFVVGLVEVGRDGGGEDRLRDPVRAVRADVAGDLAAAHGEADEGHVGQVEVFQ